MTKFFTSDTHFSHANILRLGSGRPFATIEEHDEALIANWNAVVGPNDTVFHLGDVALGKIAESLPLIGRLNGYKILVPGNHDRIFSGEKQTQRERFMPEYRKVFREIWPERGGVVAIFGADGMFDVAEVSHFPYQGDHTEHDRHVDKRPEDNGRPLIHGHIHEKRRIDGRMFNVGVDVNGFTPVSEETIAEWIRGL